MFLFVYFHKWVWSHKGFINYAKLVPPLEVAIYRPPHCTLFVTAKICASKALHHISIKDKIHNRYCVSFDGHLSLGVQIEVALLYGCKFID